MESIVGATLAIVANNESEGLLVAAIKRDSNKPINFAGFWELPGGGIEDNETEEECAIRECLEEIGIRISTDEIIYKDDDVEARVNLSPNAFLIAIISLEKAKRLRLGNEGEDCQFIPICEFLSRNDVIADHQIRLRRCLGKIGLLK